MHAPQKDVRVPMCRTYQQKYSLFTWSVYLVGCLAVFICCVFSLQPYWGGGGVGGGSSPPVAPRSTRLGALHSHPETSNVQVHLVWGRTKCSSPSFRNRPSFCPIFVNRQLTLFPGQKTALHPPAFPASPAHFPRVFLERPPHVFTGVRPHGRCRSEDPDLAPWGGLAPCRPPDPSPLTPRCVTWSRSCSVTGLHLCWRHHSQHNTETILFWPLKLEPQPTRSVAPDTVLSHLFPELFSVLGSSNPTSSSSHRRGLQSCRAQGPAYQSVPCSWRHF